MFVLVLYTDNVFFICETSDVGSFKTKCPAVKYRDGRKYTARVLSLHEDPTILEEIRCNLEGGTTPVSFSHFRNLQEKPSYSDILKKHKQCRDTTKLYLDATILPSQSLSSVDYIFSLRGQNDTDNFFRTQGCLTACEIMRNVHDALNINNISIEITCMGQDKEYLPEREIEIEIPGMKNSMKEFAPQNVIDKTTIRSEPENNIQDVKVSIEQEIETLITDKMYLIECQAPNANPDNKNSSWREFNNATHDQTSKVSTESRPENEMSVIEHRDENGNEFLNEKNSKKCKAQIPIKDGRLKVSILDDNDNCISSETQKFSKGPENTFAEILNERHESQGNVIEEIIFDVKEIGVQESFPYESAPEPKDDMALNPNATYNLDLMALELSTDANNFLDQTNEINNNIKPHIVSDVILPKPIMQQLKTTSYFLRRDSCTSTSPVGCSTMIESSAGCSTMVESFAPHTLTGDDENDEASSDDYVPEPESSSSEAMSVTDELSKTSVSRKQKRKKKNNDSSLNITLGAKKHGMSAPDDAELTVMNSKVGSKKHFCCYCHKLQTKLARHLELAHKNEEDVKKFVALPTKSLERMQIIAAIRKNGNYLYNTDKRFNKGDLLVVRRPQERMCKSAQDFAACGNCKGQYSKSVIRHHFRKCTKKDGSKERIVMVKGRKISARVHFKASAMVRNHIFPYMREDAIVRGIRYDHLITLYANKQCEKYGVHQHLFQMIRARLRLLGRFLTEIKQLNCMIKEFSDVFQPRYYDDAVASVKIVAGFNETTRTFKHPAVASNLGTLLKHVGEILRSEYIKEERPHDQKRVEDFLKLQSENYGTSVNRAALETQLQNNRRKKVILPNVEDITKLHNFLKDKRDTYFESLNEKFSEDCWHALAEVTLTSLQVFNRRRAGEIERVCLDDFDSYQGIDEVANKDMYAALSKDGQALARKYVRFMIRGKRGRSVPVLVPSKLLDALLLVRKHRDDAGVPKNNPYLFGIPSKDRDRFKYLRACILLRQFSEQCGAKVPSALRGTQLRKHMATKCISLNLSENQISDLANFMGHADKIHKEIYRQPVMQNDIVKISRLLEIAQGSQDSSMNADDSSTEEEDDDAESAGEEENSCSETEGEKNDTERSVFEKKKSNTIRSVPRSARQVTSHRRWTDDERETVLGVFQTIIRAGQMPTGDQIRNLIATNDCLKGREVAQVRTWLHTQKKKACKSNLISMPQSSFL